MGKLTTQQVRHAKPGRHADGRGLYLNVKDGGTKSWLFRYEHHKRERWMGLGSVEFVTLAQARERAFELRRKLKDEKIDPLEQRRATAMGVRLAGLKGATFAEVARRCVEMKVAEWRSDGSRREWISTLERYAFPVLGPLPIAAIDTVLVHRVLEPTAGETRVATARRAERAPSIEQILHVLRTMAAESAVERRDRALIAFTLLTGARDRAIASIRLKHMDVEKGCVLQDARDVRTKFSKTFPTTFFPVGEEVRAIVADWAEYLARELLWSPEDPLFPKTRIALGAERRFQAVGLERKPWSNADPIRRTFRQAFEAAGLPYFNPHSFRKTLVALGQRRCRTPEEFKAWSQNLGHEGVLTTFTSYGQVSTERQVEIIKSLGRAETDSLADPAVMLRSLAEQLERRRALE